MKKRLFSILLSICMVFTMIPMAGGAVFAATATSVKIGGVELNANKPYYHNGVNGAVGEANKTETGANAEFDAIKGTLTLNGLNVNSNESGIRWENESGGFNDLDLTIILAGNSNNTIVNTVGSGIVGTTGGREVGPSLTIKGKGALNVTGSNSGIWVWKNITIEDSAAVNITGDTNGICNNIVGTTTIKDEAYVKINARNGDGIGSDHGGTNNLKVNGGALVISAGNMAVMDKAVATVATESNYSITGGDSESDTKEVTNISTAKCKYLRVEPAAYAYADKVYIYLRTLDKDSNGSIEVPANQLKDLGINYYDDDGYGYWVDFGSYMSVKAYGYSKINHARGSNETNAVVNETKAAAIDKNAGITFDRLDALTWDTLSWSQNKDGSKTWHLNGEIPLCKVKFDLNYKGADSLTRYAVKGTDVNTRLPAAPARANYTFGGWYTEAGGGEEITKIPVLNDDVTYYAHWYTSTVTAYPVTVTAGEGMSTTGEASQTVTQGNAMKDVVYTTDSGYYFPEDYTVNSVNGISVTRNSYTKITVSGTPTMSAGITLPAATAKTTAEIPQAAFVATGNNSGKLTNVDSGMKYRINNGAWTDITGSEIELNNLGACTIEVVKKGGETTRDSEEQNIEVTKAATPNLAVMQPIGGRDKGSIETTTDYEIRKDGESSYTDCTAGTTSLEPGTYYIRVKASGAELASEEQKIVINDPAEYTITFDANGGYFNNTSDTKKTLKLTSGETITEPGKPSKLSSKQYTYEFSGWYTDRTGGKRLDAGDKASETVTYYAQWIETPREYSITYDADGGTINEDYNKTYTCETRTINFPTKVTRAGYNFNGWSSTEGSETPLEEWNVTEDNLANLTFYALWTAIDAVQPKVSINPTAAAINCGDTADITVTAEADTEAEYKLTYQWYESTDGSNAKGTLIDGATGNTYTVPADKEAGTYYYFCKVKAVRVDNSKFVIVKSDVATVTVTKKSTGHYKPTQKPEIIAGEGTKADLTLNGTKATITVEDGYEITDVIVNGTSLGKVTEITGLKTGDKVEIKTAKKQTEPEFNISSYVKNLKLVARSSKTANGNIRIKVASVTDQNGNPVDLSVLKNKGYTVKYKFYRSEKKAAEYGARIEKDTDNNVYINNTGSKGTKYFYKVRVMVYDANGKLVAKSELKQCKYATRTWSK